MITVCMSVQSALFMAQNNFSLFTNLPNLILVRVIKFYFAETM